MSTWKTTFVSTLTGLAVVTTTLAAPSLASAQFRDDQVTHTQGQPSTDKVDDAMRLVRQAEMEDPAGFARRVAILEQLGDTFRLPHESTLGSTDMDRLAFAATVQDPLVLQGLVEMVSRGDIEIIEGTHGAPVWISHLDPEDLTASKEPTTQDLPACPSAWAAALAWTGANALMCTPLVSVPPAAVGCALTFGIGGFIIDVNQGC